MVYCKALRDLAQQLFRKKSLDEACMLETPLKRCLTTWHMVFFGISQMIGAGIFVLIGSVIKQDAGPAAVFSFALCAVSSLFTGLCYVEFSTLVPRAGSCYTFTYVTMGELPAFIIGWTMLSDLLLTVASVAKAFSSTVDALTHRAISNFTLTHMPLPSSSFLDVGPDWLAFGLILAVAVITAAGATMSMTVTALFTAIVLLSLALMTCLCFVYGSPTNWEQFAPFGVSGVLKGATIAVFAFSGFESLANAAEECETPRRSLPVSLLTSLGVVGALYLTACLGLSYLVNYKLVDVGSPFVAGFAHSRAPWAQYVAAAGTLFATGSSKISTVYTIPRLFYALASDRLIFECFAAVSPRFGVPLAGLALGAVISAVSALLLSVETLASLYSLGILLSYVAVGLDLYILRYLLSGDPEPRAWAPGFVGRHPATVAKAALTVLALGSLLLGLVFSLATPLATWWSWLLTCLAVAPPALAGVALCAFKPAAASELAYASPLMPMAPMLTVLVNAVLMASLQLFTWLRFFIWTVVGLLIYGLYGYKHSKARPTDEYVLLAESPETETDGNKPTEGTRLE